MLRCCMCTCAQDSSDLKIGYFEYFVYFTVGMCSNFMQTMIISAYVSEGDLFRRFKKTFEL